MSDLPVHLHTATPDLDAPWCAECSARLDRVLWQEVDEDEVLWSYYEALAFWEDCHGQ